MLRIFGFSFFLTIAAIIVAWVVLGPEAAWVTIVLIAIEIAFSFDNAVINAKILERLSRFWQQLFLTVGMLIAIVGVRFILPIVIVMITADLSWSQVIDAALNDPEAYGKYLDEAHYSIAAFGGSFLLVLTLFFLFDDAREELWLERIERPLQKIGGSFWLPLVLSGAIVTTLSFFAGGHQREVLQAGLFGVILYAVIQGIIVGLGRFEPKEKKIYTGWAAFLAFMYLQLLDASFSLDGVLGAFAITNQILLIALGLGVGAIWVRSLTVFLVRRGTLGTYIYLEHGAHYAILVLAVALLASIFITVPEAITGIVGIGVLGSSFYASRQVIKARQKSPTHT